jgi:hypothetical protein
VILENGEASKKGMKERKKERKKERSFIFSTQHIKTFI